MTEGDARVGSGPDDDSGGGGAGSDAADVDQLRALFASIQMEERADGDPSGETGDSAGSLTGEGSGAGRVRVRQKVRPDHRNQAVGAAVAVAAIACAATSMAHPTDLLAVDLVLRAAFGAVLSLAAVRASWKALLGLGSVTVVFANGPLAVGCGAVAFVTAVLVAGNHDHRHRRPRVWQIAAALAGGVAAIGLSDLTDGGWRAASTIVAVVAAAPVLWSGRRNARSATRKRADRVAIAVVGLAFLASMAFGILALEARTQAERGQTLASEGLVLARSGDSPAAVAKFQQARDAFADATRSLESPVVAPALVVPGVAQNVTAMRELAASGRSLSDSAGAALGQADYRSIAIADGTVDVAAIERMIAPVDKAVADLASTSRQLSQVDTTWLVPPVQGKFEELSDKVIESHDEAALAGQALHVAPALLGADGERRYFIAFTTPSEARAMGGFIGNYGILHVKDGTIELEVDGSTTELEKQSGDRSFTDARLVEFAANQAAFQPAKYFRNLTATPDPLTMARAVADLYPQAAGGTKIDGVFVIDPYGLAALLELTGPVKAEGLDQQLTAENAVDYLLVGQYASFEGDRAGRKDALEEAAHATFDALTHRKLPGPARIGKVLGPAVAQGRIQLVPLDDGPELALAERVGLAKRFGALPGVDVISLRTSNAGANKLDTYLERQVVYTPTADGTPGSVSVTLRNTAPADAPRYVANGAYRKVPDGTNSQHVVLYTSQIVTTVSVDGAPVGAGHSIDLGLFTSTVSLDVPRGQSRTIVYQLGDTSVQAAVGAAPSGTIEYLVQPSVIETLLCIRRTADTCSEPGSPSFLHVTTDVRFEPGTAQPSGR